MSSDFKCVKYLEWCTDLPTADCPLESPIFSLNGNEWFFRLYLDQGSYSFAVDLELKTKKVDFEAVFNRYTVGFKDEEAQCISKGSFELQRNWRVWNMLLDELQSKLPSNYMAGNKMKFVFYFNNVDESVLKIIKRTGKWLLFK